MPHQFFVFTNAPDPHVTLSHDSGWTGTAVPGTDPQGRAGVVFDVPDTVPGANGAQLNLDAAGKTPLQVRGVLVYSGTRAYLQCDDFQLEELPTAPEPPTPPTPAFDEPLDVINHVYASGSWNLKTKDGCGQFTEACCEALAKEFGTMWGHVYKTAGQNQYNAHAVDAIMALYGEYHGIWDIIISSASADARPAFNYAGDVNPALWRPPLPLPCVAMMKRAGR